MDILMNQEYNIVTRLREEHGRTALKKKERKVRPGGVGKDSRGSKLF